jgi:YaeC family lipoprotein
MNEIRLITALLVSVSIFPANFALARSTVRVGVTDGPQAEIMQQVKKNAASRDLDLQIVPFHDGGSINRALAAGKIDAASFQDGVALDAEIKSHGYPLVRAGLTVTLPIGLYSRKIGKLNLLPRGATVAIPGNPLDAARALMLLHNYGLIDFRAGAGLQVTVRDITRNPRKLRFIELPAGQLARSLGQVSLAALNYPEASKAGLFPARDAVGMEDSRSPYAGVLAIRSGDARQPWVAQLISAYHSDEIKHFILVRYQDSVRRPW